VLKTDDNFVVGNQYLNLNPASGTPVFNLNVGGVNKGFLAFDGSEVCLASATGIPLLLVAGSGVITVIGNLIPSGSLDIGSSTSKWRNVYCVNLYADNMPNIPIPWTSVPSDIIPDANLTRNLGSSSKAWNNIYAGYGWIGDLYFTNRLFCGLLTADPSLSEGVVWYRSDVDKLYIYTTAKKQVFPADWDDITSKPSTFPPSAHTHARSDVTDFWASPFWGNIPDKPSTFPASTHASTHASGGSDPVSLNASQIISGTLSLDRIPTIPYSKTDFANQNLLTTSDVIFNSVKAQGTMPAIKCGDSSYSYIDLTFDSVQAYLTAHYRHLTLSRDSDKEVTINPLTDSQASESALNIGANTWTDLLTVSRTLAVAKKALIIGHAVLYNGGYNVVQDGYTGFYEIVNPYADWELRILVDNSQPTGAFARTQAIGYFADITVFAIVSLSSGSHTIKLQGYQTLGGTQQVYHRRLDVLYL
jgi:hypothetical protein